VPNETLFVTLQINKYLQTVEKHFDKNNEKWNLTTLQNLSLWTGNTE
jgi:hypothetical protein